ncbi:hypothetical protein GCM10010168_53240 [Actinoplanes ianthinogenes]|nr:hypothetical protein GCM10010168_53240 [Actinoplanes ianthinogenes]
MPAALNALDSPLSTPPARPRTSERRKPSPSAWADERKNRKPALKPPRSALPMLVRSGFFQVSAPSLTPSRMPCEVEERVESPTRWPNAWALALLRPSPTAVATWSERALPTSLLYASSGDFVSAWSFFRKPFALGMIERVA